MKYLILIVALCAGLNAFATPTERACVAKKKDIADKLSCLDGVKFTEGKSPAKGYREFNIEFTQPIDHANPSGGAFTQRLALIHIDENEPVLLETSGYNLFGVYLTRVAKTFGANQIEVEHRFFAPSIPAAPVDWTKLDIKQSADDFHAITAAFKQIYGKNWVNTGASKGGMTSLYHHRFYPDDMAGTIADVAPLSFSTTDQRYPAFLEKVGGVKYKTCRTHLMNLQRSLLENRTWLEKQMKGTYTGVGGVDQAFEGAVSDLFFIFWQYDDPEDADSGCPGIPAKGTPEGAYKFLNVVNSVDQYTDDQQAPFFAYNWQVATQLGGPENLNAQIQDLLLYPQYNDDVGGIPHTYSNAAMHDIDKWARNDADHVIYVYGEFDPWSAGAFPESETGKDVHKYIQPGGNHGSNIFDLPAAQKKEAMALLTAWFGKEPAFLTESVNAPALEDVELQARRHYHLP